MILFIDTDLTGKFHYKEPPDAAIQPHLSRLSMLLAEERDGAPALEYSRLIEPRASWHYEPEAIVATGISRHAALETGQPLEIAWKHLRLMQKEARLLVAFNWDHHRRVLVRTAADMKDPDATFPLLREPGVLCAMRASAEMVGKPRMSPGGGYAWPKLGEAYEVATGAPMQLPHPDPVEQGLIKVRAIQAIHQGIERHTRVS